MSYSYVPREELMQQQLVVSLQDLYQRFANEDGFVYIVDSTSVHILEAIEN